VNNKKWKKAIAERTPKPLGWQGPSTPTSRNPHTSSTTLSSSVTISKKPSTSSLLSSLCYKRAPLILPNAFFISKTYNSRTLWKTVKASSRSARGSITDFPASSSIWARSLKCPRATSPQAYRARTNSKSCKRKLSLQMKPTRLTLLHTREYRTSWQNRSSFSPNTWRLLRL